MNVLDGAVEHRSLLFADVRGCRLSDESLEGG